MASNEIYRIHPDDYPPELSDFDPGDAWNSLLSWQDYEQHKGVWDPRIEHHGEPFESPHLKQPTQPVNSVGNLAVRELIEF